MIAFASSLDQCGPLTRDVTDAALLFRHMEGERDRCDSTSLGIPGRGRPAERRAARRPALRRLGPARSRGSSRAWPSRSRGARSPRSRSSAAACEEIELPHAGHGISAYYVIAPAEASANLARYDGVRYGPRARDGDLTSLYEQTRARRLRRRGQAPHHDRHLRALVRLLRGLLRHRAEGAHEDRRRTSRRPSRRSTSSSRPTSPTVAFKLGERTEDPLAMYLSDYFTVPMPLAGIPAISIPVRARRTACRWASRSRARRSARAGSSTPRTRWRRRSRFEGVPVVADTYEPVIGIEIHVPAAAPGRRCSAAARCRSATSRTRTPARSASATPARCR